MRVDSQEKASQNSKPEVRTNASGIADLPTRIMGTVEDTDRSPVRIVVANPYSFLDAAISDDELGRLGHYRVLRLLGQGGMGFVFLAEDSRLGRQIALKVLKPELAGDPELTARFLREARITASIRHQHLVTVYQVGQENGVVFLAMELLEGETLEQHVGANGLHDVSKVIRISREITNGLAAIHAQGLVHRDIKPSNLWLDRESNRVKILDFGLARFIDDDVKYTKTGMVVGTPGFMSPEQARGDAVDARSDLFSLGAVLYCMCTGMQPFHASNTLAVLSSLALNDPRPPLELNKRMPPALSHLIMRLLRKNPAERPATAHDVLAALDHLAEGDHRHELLTKLRSTNDRPALAPTTPVKNHQRWLTALLSVAIFAGVGLLVGPTIKGWWFGPIHPHLADRADVTFLSDLTPFDIENWIDRPPAPPREHWDGPEPPPMPPKDVIVRGRFSPHGLFMHPPLDPNGGRTRISYRLDGRFREFHTEVSLNDGPRRCDTPLTMSVYGDGKLIWQSKPILSQRDTQMAHGAVEGVSVLTLELICPGEPRGAHAVWIEPHVR